MKILHFCAGNQFIENLEYQENVFPRKHKELGHEVKVFCNTYTFNPDGTKGKKEVGTYINRDGIEVTVLPYKKGKFNESFKKYDGVYEKIEAYAPDVIFIHGTQSFSMGDVKKYKRKQKQVKIYADQHGDYINTPVDTFKRRILHTVIWGTQVRKAGRFCEMVWGVLPLRVRYLREVYKLPKKKTELLVMGGDESKINFDNKDGIRTAVREKYGILQDDFLMVTGGKIDSLKNIHLLVEAVKGIENDKIKLLIFGEPSPELKPFFDEINDARIIKAGWVDSAYAYDLFLASDLAVFPGSHSVLWEQAAATGVPLIVKKWDGLNHIDVGGNCLFTEGDSAENIKSVIEKVICEDGVYDKMMQTAQSVGIKTFSYREIAKRAIGLDK